MSDTWHEIFPIEGDAPMTDKQPEALQDPQMQMWLEYCAMKEEVARLYEVNAELVGALKAFTKCWVRPFPAAPEDMYNQQQVIDQAKAALAKAQGENNDQ